MKSLCFCWFPVALLAPIQMGNNMASPKKVLKSVFTHVANNYENLLEQTKAFA